MSEHTDTTPDGTERTDIMPNDGPWGFKRFPGMERDLAIKAAKRAKMTIQEWVAEAIRAHVESERDESHGYDVFPPGGNSPRSGEMVPHQVSISPLSVTEIGQAIEIAERIAKIRNRTVPVKLLAGAMRALALRMTR